MNPISRALKKGTNPQNNISITHKSPFPFEMMIANALPQETPKLAMQHPTPTSPKRKRGHAAIDDI